jgi:hypothetical protein
MISFMKGHMWLIKGRHGSKIDKHVLRWHGSYKNVWISQFKLFK